VIPYEDGFEIELRCQGPGPPPIPRSTFAQVMSTRAFTGLQVTLRYADGREELDDLDRPDRAEPITVLALGRRGSSDDTRWLWVMPVPPPGEVRLTVEWPTYDVEDVSASFDGATIRPQGNTSSVASSRRSGAREGSQLLESMGDLRPARCGRRWRTTRVLRDPRRHRDDASRFGTGNDDGVDCGATAGAVAEFACAASERHWQFLTDVAGLEQPVHCGVVALTSRDRLDEDNGRNQRWPRSVSDTRADCGDCILVAIGEEAHSPGVEDEHPQLALDDPAFPPRTRWASRSARATDAGEGSPTSSTSSDR
jgi:hypothetical protein